MYVCMSVYVCVCVFVYIYIMCVCVCVKKILIIFFSRKLFFNSILFLFKQFLLVKKKSILK